MKEKRTEINIETDRVWFISSPRLVVGWCAVCGAVGEMLPLDEAAILRRVSSRTMFQWVNEGKVHFREMANGRLLICLAQMPDKNPGF